MSTPTPGPDPARLDDAAALIAAARRITVFTGAGMSAESGVPTFRDALTGLWERFRPEDLATPEAWQRDRELVWSWYADRAAGIRQVSPNAGHRAVAALGERLAARGGALTVVTQNVDDLHERSGSPVASHLHGSLFAPRCEDCGRPGDPELAPAAQLPRCPHCGGALRPGVVWFGEMLPEADWAAAEAAFDTAELVLVIGTSGVVYPAAALPGRAADRGVPIIEVNPAPSALTPLTTVFLAGTAARLLPALLTAP